MTKEEALLSCVEINCRNGVCDRDVSFDETRLRALGYIVIPVEPSDAEIEAMAKELCISDGGYWNRLIEREPFPQFHEGSLTTRDDLRNDAKAARAALVKFHGGGG